jgi:hypothetical protein
MNVEIETEAAQFREKEYIYEIAVAVRRVPAQQVSLRTSGPLTNGTCAATDPKFIFVTVWLVPVLVVL